jgi:DNA modification methylase
MSTSSITQSLSQVPQALLDLEVKERSNVFAWRGQFSPELVEVLLKTYAREGDIVFDPFAGVGTTLLEAAKQGMRSRGTELNPSAFLMAQSVEWVRYSPKQRESFISVANELMGKALFDQSGASPFAEVNIKEQARKLASLARESALDSEVKQILANTLIRAMGNDSDFRKAFRQHCQILRSLPVLSTSHRMFHADARATPLTPESVDLVLTSPPYINVFNYHENNRQAMEMLGWDILSIAQAELGSNRKNRGNRFLTVIQYCLDMQAVLVELKRVLKRTGKILFIVGRESMVRGVPFQNGELVASLAEISGFRVTLRQDRKFLNRFGQNIIEDILYLEQSNTDTLGDARRVAITMLSEKAKLQLQDGVRFDLEEAIRNAVNVLPSPLYGR